MFNQQQPQYVKAIAATVNVPTANVVVLSVTSVALSRRGLEHSGRRQSATGGGVDILTRIIVPAGLTASAVAGQVTLNAVNVNLAKVGLPSATSLPQPATVIVGLSPSSSSAVAAVSMRSGGASVVLFLVAAAAAAAAAG